MNACSIRPHPSMTESKIVVELGHIRLDLHGLLEFQNCFPVAFAFVMITGKEAKRRIFPVLEGFSMIGDPLQRFQDCAVPSFFEEPVKHFFKGWMLYIDHKCIRGG